jgi:hypothetical protein
LSNHKSCRFLVTFNYGLFKKNVTNIVLVLENQWHLKPQSHKPYSNSGIWLWVDSHDSTSMVNKHIRNLHTIIEIIVSTYELLSMIFSRPNSMLELGWDNRMIL